MVPLRELHINPNGRYRNCCIQLDTVGKIDLTVDNPNDWFANDPGIKVVRNALQLGVKHPTCRKCWNLEENNMSSYRVNWNRQYEQEGNTDLTSRIEIIDLRLGNRCNLKCRMCNSTWSNQISDQIVELKSMGVNNSYTNMPVLGTVKQDDEFMSNLFYFIEKTPTIKEIKFAGGEPFAMEEVEEFLYKLVEHKITNVKISLLTNTTLVKDRIVETLEKFKSTHIQCSIDGLGEMLEYQRHPSKWEVIERNFIKLYNANLTVNLTPCWSNLNVLSMADFLEWTAQFPKSHVAYNEVNEPSYLNWRHVPLDARSNELSKLKSMIFHPKVHKDYKKFVEKFEVEYIEFSNDDLIKFKDAITAWDLTSKTKYQDLYSWNKLILK
jgi:sulfatase maturation enzyme AslB (radical SAM superfamily)